MFLFQCFFQHTSKNIKHNNVGVGIIRCQRNRHGSPEEVGPPPRTAIAMRGVSSDVIEPRPGCADRRLLPPSPRARRTEPAAEYGSRAALGDPGGAAHMLSRAGTDEGRAAVDLSGTSRGARNTQWTAPRDTGSRSGLRAQGERAWFRCPRPGAFSAADKASAARAPRTTSRPTWCSCQNPRGPPLAVAVGAAPSAARRLSSPWHNFGYAIDGTRLGAGHSVVRRRADTTRCLRKRRADRSPVVSQRWLRLAHRWGSTGASSARSAGGTVRRWRSPRAEPWCALAARHLPEARATRHGS